MLKFFQNEITGLKDRGQAIELRPSPQEALSQGAQGPSCYLTSCSAESVTSADLMRIAKDATSSLHNLLLSLESMPGPSFNFCALFSTSKIHFFKKYLK
jgi:hypothetical protein